jgi:hypothetical protein
MKLAMWLLRKFGVPKRNESLLGDLVEERAAGRSIFWLYGQTVAAIVDTILRDLRDHWVLALRAIAVGWGASAVIFVILGEVPYPQWWKNPDPHVRDQWAYIFLGLGMFVLFIWPTILGWIVARTHRSHPAAMVLAFAASVALVSPWICVQGVTPTTLEFGLSGLLGVLFGGFLSSRPVR